MFFATELLRHASYSGFLRPGLRPRICQCPFGVVRIQANLRATGESWYYASVNTVRFPVNFNNVLRNRLRQLMELG